MTEILYFFIAEYESEMKVSERGGHEDETENIEVLEVLLSDAIQMITTGEIRDGKTIMLLQHIQLKNLI